MKVTAAVLRTHDGPFTIEELELGTPRDDEVVVRIVGAGLCHTDVLARELPPEYFPGPIVYGHEGAGVVESVGPEVTKVAPGDHVVLTFRSCGGCVACTGGHPAYCVRLSELNGVGRRTDGTTAFTDADGKPVASHYFGQSSFASHVVAAAASVVKVDHRYDLARLGPLGCGVQTGAGAVFNVFDLQEDESIVIAGAGALGLSAVMAAKARGAKTIIVIERHENRRDLARKYGATDVLNVPAAELATAIQEVTGGGADYALDLTGNAEVISSCLHGLNWLGTLGLCGVGFGPVTFDLPTLMSGRTIRTVIEGDSRPEAFIPYLADLNAQGSFPFDDLIETFRLEQINEAAAASAGGAVVKPVFVFD
jgi:aryl-alcohol dehydrogenase